MGFTRALICTCIVLSLVYRGYAEDDTLQKARSPYVSHLGGLSLGDLGSNLPLTLPSLTTLSGTPTVTTTTIPLTTASSRKKRSDEISEAKLIAGQDSVQGARSPHVFNLGGLPSLGDLGSSLPLTLPSLTTLGGTPTVTTTTVPSTTASSRKKRSEEISEAKLIAGQDSVQGARLPYVFNLGGLPSLGDLGSKLPFTLPSLTTSSGSSTTAPTITTPVMTTPTVTAPSITTSTTAAPTTTSTAATTTAASRKKRSYKSSEVLVPESRSPYIFNLGGLPSLGDLGSSLPLTLPSLTTLDGTPTITTTTVASTTTSSRKKRSDEILEAKLIAGQDSVQGARSPYVFNLGGLPSLGDLGSKLPFTLPSLTTSSGSSTITTPVMTTPTVTTPSITTSTTAAPTTTSTAGSTTAASRKKRSYESSESLVQKSRLPYVFNLAGVSSLGDLGSSLPLTLPSFTTLGGTPTLTTTTVAPTTASSRKKRSEEISEAKLIAGQDSVQGARSPYVFNLGGLPSLGDLGSKLPFTLPSLITSSGSSTTAPTITTPVMTTPTVTAPSITTSTTAAPTTTSTAATTNAASRKKRSYDSSEALVQESRSPYVFNLGGLPSLGDLGSSLPLTLPSLTTLGGTPTITTTTVAPTTASNRRKRSPGSFGLLPSNIVSCNYTAQPEATCRSCQETLNCFSNNIGLVKKCRGRLPHCNEGQCSNTQSAECGGTTTTITTTTTTAAPVTTEAETTTTTAAPSTTEAATTTAELATTEAATTTAEPATTEPAVSTTALLS